MNKRRFFYLLPIIPIFIVIVAGWFATDYLGNKARQEILGESQASVMTLSIYVSSAFTSIERAVHSLAGSPYIAPALLTKGEPDIELANSVLDRYNAAHNASVSYLMDVGGMTLASSNRYDPDSFVGKSYDFRHYFQEAAKGQVGRYFAMGVTSGKRGFYASYPVRNPSGEVIGVVTMKKDIDGMESFFSKYPFCFLISPEGIIFLSSKPAMVAKSLWPLEESVREKLIASRQFGDNIAAALINKEIADGMDVSLGKYNYFVSRKAIDNGGWSIILLTPTDRIGLYRWIGVLATFSVSILLMVFSAVIYVTNRSKEVFRQSEESKRLLLHAVGDGIFGVDTSGKLTFVNPAALRMLGFTEEEMLCQSVHSLVHHSRKDGSKYPLEDCPMCTSYIHAKDSYVADEVLWRKDGGSFPVEYSSMPITKDGKVTGAVVSFKDSTERKRAAEELQDISQRLKLAASSAKLGIWDWDLTSNKMVWDERMLELYGLTRETFPGGIEAWQNGLHLEDRDKTIEECQAALRGEKEWDTDFRVLHPDGTIKHIKANGMVIRDSAGTPVRMLGTNFDITERKQAKDALLNEKKFSEAIIESIPGMLYVYDDQGNHIRHNKRHEKMTGYSAEELSHLNPLSWYDDRADIIRVEAAISDAFTKGYGEVEVPMRIKSGEKLMMHFTGSRLVMNGKKYFVGVGTDITARKLAEMEKAQLEALNRQLQKAESLGRMAGAIAHHFNNQLYAVMGNLEMAMEDLPGGADISETLSEAQKAARKAADVSKLMLTYLGQNPGNQEPIDLSDACSKCLPLLQAAIPKGITIDADFHSSGPVIRADINQMQQIITNLATNAWEAISDNRGAICLTIKTVSHVDITTTKRFPIDWQPQSIPYACLEVSDTGSGITNKDIEKLFDPFFTTKFIGQGLGLPVVLGIVKAYGGGVTVESESGRGSVFRIFLPVSTEELPIRHDLTVMPEALTTRKAEKISEIESGGTVLLIEDEEQVRNMVKKMLTRLGYKALEANDGAEAVDIFRKHLDEIICVLSDLTMPFMNGWETLAALRRISPDIPAILSSGYDEAQVMAEEHTEQPDAFLGKPYQLKGLRETISRVLAANNNDGNQSVD